MGHPTYPLSQQIADTRAVHGDRWTFWHYVINPRGPMLSPWEWSILGRQG